MHINHTKCNVKLESIEILEITFLLISSDSCLKKMLILSVSKKKKNLIRACTRCTMLPMDMLDLYMPNQITRALL